MVDEDRFPPVYETAELRAWRVENLRTQEQLKENGLEFERHYTGATACCPSRATLFTGQYPSLHGVSQTDGAAKSAFDPDMFWLDPNTVPTMGDYLRTAGYLTLYKGKWHISEADILIPGTKNALPSYDPVTGAPDPETTAIYLNANRLEPFGFNGWIGPEPHTTNPRNSGSSAAIGLSGRDVVYAAQAVELIDELDRARQAAPERKLPPWLIVASFVNPHDIALFGELTRLSPLFRFTVDPTVPFIPPAPTADESLLTKPRAQRDYRGKYPLIFQPLFDALFFRQLYYSLQKQVDERMQEVLAALRNSSFYEDTIVIFTSDHGDLLGAHGGLLQKWYNAYEEAIHVPLIVHNPRLIAGRQRTEMLTSHVDILPTMLGLAGIDVEAVQEQLRRDHTEVHRLVGRDLSPLILGTGEPERATEPIYFMTDDNISRGPNQVNILGVPYQSVVQPNHIETVIARLPTARGEQLFKYSRYFDNPQFWSDPGCKDVVATQGPGVPVTDDIACRQGITTTKTQPAPDEIELYNLTEDPLETKNLADPEFATPESRVIQQLLAIQLQIRCTQKRLTPRSDVVPGQPPCNPTCTQT